MKDESKGFKETIQVSVSKKAFKGRIQENDLRKGPIK